MKMFNGFKRKVTVLAVVNIYLHTSGWSWVF